MGGIVNLLLLAFHVKQSNKSTTILVYCLMNGTDLLICVLMIPTVISCWAGSKPLFFESLVAREIWLFLWEVSGRISVFLIGLQSVLRTRALVYPFSRRIKKRSLAVVVLTYFILLSSIQTVHLFLQVYSVFSSNTNRPTLIMTSVQDVWGRDSVESITFLLANNFFGYVVPFLPILISCLISVHSIRKSGKRVQESNKSTRRRAQDDNHQAASTTVVLLTLVYLVTNALIFTLDLNNLLLNFSKMVKMRLYFIDWNTGAGSYNMRFIICYVITYNICVLLNSTFNGLVFLIRTKAVRKFTQKILGKLSRTDDSIFSGPEIVPSEFISMDITYGRSKSKNSAPCQHKAVR